jgi:lincosamide nucleotidyltransferase A/C/D/E
MSDVWLTSVSGPKGTPVGAWLDRPVHRRSSWPAAIRPIDRLVVAVTADPADDGTTADRPALPSGAATAEAEAVRALRAGASPAWSPAQELSSAGELLDLCRRRGRDSVDVARADATLVTQLQLGAWTEAGWRTRGVRRVLVRRGLLVLTRGVSSTLARTARPGTVGLLADLAFWVGVRSRATRSEWRRWTASYVVLSYHRISDDAKPDQELIEVTPRRFAAQMSLLQRLGFTPLTPQLLIDRHHSAAGDLPRRGFVVTADDGFLDCTEPLRVAGVHAELFVPTADVGGRAERTWHEDHPSPGWGVDGEPLADWSRLQELAADDVFIGGHARRHTALTALDDTHLREQLEGSRADLRAHLHAPIDAMAYPHGLHDERVRASARDAGFRLAYTTQFGRNGVGTDPWCLRRVPVFRDDGLPTVLWKVLTGEPPPPGPARLLGKAAALGRLLRRPNRAGLEDTTRGRAALARLVGVDERRALSVLDALAAAGVEAWVAGGWGIDALLGRTTRPHGDLDLVVPADTDETALAAALRPVGFTLRRRVTADGVAFNARWVFRDRGGRALDILPVGGRAPFTADATVRGKLGGRAVTCLSPAAQRSARVGYPLRVEDLDALRSLERAEDASG